MKWIAFLTLFFTSPMLLAQIYKCSLPSGEQIFQEYPCNKVESKEVDLNQQSVISNDNYQPDSNSYDSSTNTQRNIENYRARSEEIIRERDEKICQIYKDSLTSAEERWESIRRNGYKQYEKEMYEQRINDAERAVERNC